MSEAIRAGTFASGFEHYGLIGHKDPVAALAVLRRRSIFRRIYLISVADLLAAGHYANGYDHYLRTGDREWRSGHLLFDPAMHHEAAALLAPGRHDGSWANIRRFLTGNRRVGSTHRLSWYFDPIWYLSAYPGHRGRRSMPGGGRARSNIISPTAGPPRSTRGSIFPRQYYRDLYPDIRIPTLDSRNHPQRVSITSSTTARWSVAARCRRSTCKDYFPRRHGADRHRAADMSATPSRISSAAAATRAPRHPAILEVAERREAGNSTSWPARTCCRR